MEMVVARRLFYKIQSELLKCFQLVLHLKERKTMQTKDYFQEKNIYTKGECFIHGERVQGKGKTLQNINPATGKTIQDFYACSSEQMQEAIVSSQKGFAIWRDTPANERAKVLHKAAQLLRERNDSIAHIETLDTGKPIAEAISVDVISGADAIEYYAGIAPAIHGDYHDLTNAFAYTRKEPLGVCAGIGAWNYPIQIAAWKSAPALATGNSMIFKPSELTPLSAVILAEIYHEAGLPAGVFNVVQGDADVGKIFTSHQDIAKVSLTGEVGTGKKVMAACASTLKHVTLELGGKSPLIICEDAPLEEAAQAAMMANFYTQGEICSNGTRVYVARKIKEKFLQLLVEKTKRLVVGDPFDKKTQIGALICKEHYDKVMGYMQIGKQEGKLLCGGGDVSFANDSELKEGFFVEPTIFDTENDDARIATEEVFGPLMTVLTFDSEEEALAKANDTVYGLAAGIFTQDIQRGHRMAQKIEAGMCWINNYNINPVEIPFGPFKQSGFGKENGLATIDAYTRLKTVYVEMDKIQTPYV